jgi:hypothetical protein
LSCKVTSADPWERQEVSSTVVKKSLVARGINETLFAEDICIPVRIDGSKINLKENNGKNILFDECRAHNFHDDGKEEHATSVSESHEKKKRIFISFFSCRQ